jgi:hypothetical protein
MNSEPSTAHGLGVPSTDPVPLSPPQSSDPKKDVPSLPLTHKGKTRYGPFHTNRVLILSSIEARSNEFQLQRGGNLCIRAIKRVEALSGAAYFSSMGLGIMLDRCSAKFSLLAEL